MGILNVANSVALTVAKKKQEADKLRQTQKKSGSAANTAKTVYYSNKKSGGVKNARQNIRRKAQQIPGVQTVGKNRSSYYRAGTIQNTVNPLDQVKQGKKYYRGKMSPILSAANTVNSQGGDAGVYVRPPDWTWADDVEQLAKDRRVNRIENYTNDYRILDENPLGRLREHTKRPAGERKGNHWANLVTSGIGEGTKKTVKDARRMAGRLKWGEPFRRWVDSLPNYYEEDKGSALAQASRLASLYAAVYPTTKGYTEEQAKALQEEIRNAPVDLQNLFIKYADDISPIVNRNNKVAYFNTMTGKVYGDPHIIAQDTHTSEPYLTHWHEYGHNLDWLSGRYGDKPMYSSLYGQDGKAFGDIISEDIDHTLRKYWRTFKKDKGPYNEDEAIAAFAADLRYAYPNSTRNAAAVSDVFSPYSASLGRSPFIMGYGHDKSYWAKNPENATIEAFADLTSAATVGGNQLHFVQAFLPNTYNAYLEMLREMEDSPYSQYRMKLPLK